MVIITVNIMNVHGKKTKIEIDTSDTILDLKKKYGNSNVVLKYDGEVLKDKKKIKDYDIEDGDQIIANDRLLGGEIGSAVKRFHRSNKSWPC